ncbi:uncharacterized protein B0T23DRAFT_85609 [Neurospora hispaniola]|uniref:RRM domain-containing protein n=2 Tax=Neurospora TaxID=5140 RepID=A0AAJ0ID06_9PEZI|nr:hypothetical protein B0T23DRAFT_85609 [Neurospora hispaniola]
MDRIGNDTTMQNSDALTEGRRIYMGNLLYSVKPADVEGLLQDAGFTQYEKIHISVDPLSGRNPGYCFIEFTTREEAERALESLAGVDLCGRSVKLGPCHPKTSSQRREGASASPAPRSTFDRWGDWRSGSKPAATEEQRSYGTQRRTGSDAKEGVVQNNKRLYVGGLGEMIDQEQNDAEIREIFLGFEIVTIGKRIAPNPLSRPQNGSGSHHYCFVDFASEDEAERAMTATNGRPILGGTLRVYPAKSKAPVREAEEGSSYRPRGERTERTERTERAERPARTDRNPERQREILGARSWRAGPSAVAAE